MGTQVQIQLTLDSSGVVTGLKQLGDGLGNLPAPSPKVKKEFDGIESAERRAHIAGQLFVRTTGIEMPRALERVIATSRVMGPLLSGAFNVAIIGAAAQAVIMFAEKIHGAVEAMAGYTEEVKKAHAETVKASQEAFINPKTLETAKQHLADIGAMETANNKELEMSLKDRLARTDQQTTLLGKALGIQGILVLYELTHNKAIEKSIALNDERRQLLENQAALMGKIRQEIDGANAKAAEAGLKGFRLIDQQAKDALKAWNDTFIGEQRGTELAEAKKREIYATTAAARKELQRQITEETVQAEERAYEATLKGEAAIRVSEDNRIGDLVRALREKTGLSQREIVLGQSFQEQRVAIEKDSDFKIMELRRQATERVVQMESEAAIASLPEWQRTEAQIRVEHDKTVRQIQVDVATTVISETRGRQAVAAADQLMNARIRDEHKHMAEALGSDMESVFDDITSGNIGKRILANIKKLFFQIIAQWFLSLNVMKSAAGSIFGSIVFGPGTTGAGVFGGGGGGSILGGLLGGGSGGGSAGVSSSGGGTTGGGGAFSSFVPSAGGGTGIGLPGLGSGSGLAGAAPGIGATSSSGAGGFSASSALTSQSMGDVVGAGLTAPAMKTGSKFGGLGGLFSGQGLVNVAGLGLSLAGSAFGGKTGSAGGMLLGLLMTGKLAPLISTLFGTIGMTGTAALLGGGVGALLGFGLGQNFGKTVGALSGAGSGALTGFLVGGPIGALVGGLIGLLGGLFGGIFGGGKRKKQANEFADNTVIPDITQIVQGFDSFQIDNSAAIQQLEQLRTDAQKQLSALKGEGKSVFNNKITPAIDDAEKHIRSIETERERRAAIVFGPAQFHDGGMAVRGFGRLRANEIPAVLEHGEFVVKKGAAAKNRGVLERMNAGMDSGGGIQIGALNISTTTLDERYVKSEKFANDVAQALTRAQLGGRI